MVNIMTPKKKLYTREEAQALVDSRPWWYQAFEIFPGIRTPGVYDPSGTFGAMDFPDNMEGMSVLETGPAEGYFTKQLSNRGAIVTSCDYMDKMFHGFGIMEQLHEKPLNFIQSNLYDLPLKAPGPYDLVLCMGLLYHLPDLVRALHTLRMVCKTDLIVETLVSTDLGDEPLARYHPGSSLNNDLTNFWSPNIACTQAILNDCGFIVDRTRLISEHAGSGRAAFWCHVAPAVPGQTIKSDLAYTT